MKTFTAVKNIYLCNCFRTLRLLTFKNIQLYNCVKDIETLFVLRHAFVQRTKRNVKERDFEKCN